MGQLCCDVGSVEFESVGFRWFSPEWSAALLALLP